ncbi:MAG: hypothetical protein A2Y62_05720 [Candidatus Fischerbacteria bacterium RBG_13_37_8]|uniref:Uncharacterized protein n=1 Tax=Candidatus Fischerbacteria bacterium RBG_13_37_8 TaxID=1817863 RepID=A0A1F5VXQ0_9BACT|nr:MAG: hypothetical protein A2Y62_05720 [Candidatus Fischerbacteria bacterium RBG_13_37_8]
MKALVFHICDYTFAVNLNDVFKIIEKSESQNNNGLIQYKEYSFLDFTSKFKEIIELSYNGGLYILFANDENQAALLVETTEGIFELDSTDIYPLSENLYRDRKLLFKYYYYDARKKFGALMLDFLQFL